MARVGCPGSAATSGDEAVADEFRDIIRSRSELRWHSRSASGQEDKSDTSAESVQALVACWCGIATPAEKSWISFKNKRNAFVADEGGDLALMNHNYIFAVKGDVDMTALFLKVQHVGRTVALVQNEFRG